MLRSLSLVPILAACAQPGLEFRDAPVARVNAPAMTFSVRIRDGRAQAIRNGYVPVRHLAKVYVYAARAMETASGCNVLDKTMRGDPAVMTARLSCRESPVAEVVCKVDRMHDLPGADLVAACDDATGRRSVYTVGA